jgi:outer membrane immunogenic protein
MPALAADLSARRYNKAPAVAAPIYNWTGFYIGGHSGNAFIFQTGQWPRRPSFPS